MLSGVEEEGSLVQHIELPMTYSCRTISQTLAAEGSRILSIMLLHCMCLLH